MYKRQHLFHAVLIHVYVVRNSVFSLVSSKQKVENDIRTQRCVWSLGEGGGGRMGAAAAVLHEGMRDPMSSQSIQSKYLSCLMENLYTKVNDICMYKCMHAY